MLSFNAKIYIIGVNPYVLLPAPMLKAIFIQAGKQKGTIPVKGTLDGHVYTQTLVKYSGKWRLYLNTPMRKSAGKDVGDTVAVTIEYDSADRTIPMHPELAKALNEHPKAMQAFEMQSPSRKKEIVRYINNLKSEEAITKNITRAIQFLTGDGRFVGRDKP